MEFLNVVSNFLSENIFEIMIANSIVMILFSIIFTLLSIINVRKTKRIREEIKRLEKLNQQWRKDNVR